MAEAREAGDPETAGLLAVEQFVEQQPGIDKAVAVLHLDSDDEERLWIYVTLNDQEAAHTTAEDLQGSLAIGLSEFAVPDSVVFLEEFPRADNGDIDKALLPIPRRSTFDPSGSARAELIFQLAASVFGVPSIESADNFFDLGGTSLLASRLATLLRSLLDIEVSVRDIIDAESLGSLVEGIETRGAKPNKAEAHTPTAHSLENKSLPGQQSSARRLLGPLATHALSQAVTDLFRRHAALRMLHHDDGTLRQVTVEGLGHHATLTTIPTSTAEFANLLKNEVSRPFDRRLEPPLRAVLFQFGPANHVLLLTNDKTACDKDSALILWRDLGQAYTARAAGRAPAWERLPLQYTDYLSWQSQHSASLPPALQRPQRPMDYWRTVLKDMPRELALPYRSKSSTQARRTARSIALTLPDDLHVGLRTMARRSQATPRMVLQTALAAFLTGLGAGCDLPLGARSNGRTQSAWNGIVGSLSNDLVLRVDTSGDPTFTDLVSRVRDVALAADAHRDVPFARLAAEVHQSVGETGHALFQVALDFNRDHGEEIVFPGIAVTDLQVDTDFDLDLQFDFIEHYAPNGEPSGLSGTLRYAAQLFSAETARLLAQGLIRALQSAIAGPEHRISELSIDVSATGGDAQGKANADTEGQR
ncbi:condensation domain-containing protein [Streptomyces sp. NPDC001220]